MAKPLQKTILFFSLNAIGHINPILSIMKELQRRGHRVVLVTTFPINMAPKLKAMGFDYDYCCKPEQRKEQERNDNVVSILKSSFELFRSGPRKTFEVVYDVGGSVERYLNDIKVHHSDIEAKLKSYTPDMIVVDHIVPVPCAMKTAPVWVRFYSSFPQELFSDHNKNCVAGIGLKLEEMTSEMKEFEVSAKKYIKDKIRKFASENGIADWHSETDLVPSSPYLNLYLGPEELGLEKVFKPLPDIWFRLEHTINGPISTSFKVSESIQNLPGKLIYFSLGTLVSSDVRLMDRLLEMLSQSSNKFIVSMGKMYEQIKLFPNMWGDEFFDQKAVLSEVDLFITHGGHNSVLEAFYFGVPGLLVLPVFADQFDSAQRIHDCGYGLRLNPYECTKEQLLGSIDIILGDKQLMQRMKAASSRLQSINYHRIAVNKLENVLTSNQ